jgi:flagellar biosynthesis/type III secretory pathway chaperone
MDQQVEHLIHVLQQCEELYKRMLPIIEQEKMAAMEPNPSSLTAINDKKASLLAQLKILDRQRGLLLGQIARRWHLSPEQLTLTRLAEKARPSYRTQLSTLNSALQHIIEKVQYANDESRLMIAHCLSLVKSTMAFFNQWTDSSAVYGSTGNITSYGQGHGRLLSNSV